MQEGLLLVFSNYFLRNPPPKELWISFIDLNHAIPVSCKTWWEWISKWHNFGFFQRKSTCRFLFTFLLQVLYEMKLIAERCCFQAGKCNLAERSGGKFLVTPDPRRGTVSLVRTSDGLIHFRWNDRGTGGVEEPRIIFPDEIQFKRVKTG